MLTGNLHIIPIGCNTFLIVFNRLRIIDLGVDALGNLTRIENEIAKFPARLEAAKTRKEETIAQLEIRSS